MGFLLSLHSFKYTENESGNSVSLSLRAKGLAKIQIGSLVRQLLVCTSTSKVTEFRQIYHKNVVTLITVTINVSISTVQLHEVFKSYIKIYYVL